MRNEHILDILDSKSLAELNEAEIGKIEAHSADCHYCRNSYETAKMTSAMLKAAVGFNFEPSPFFHKRVLANLPERRIVKGSIWVFGRIWNAAGTLVVLMITTVLILVALTVFAPNKSSEQLAGGDNEADMVILEKRNPTRELNNEQIFQVVYGVDEKK